jgi:putative ABC transport system permease protein
MKTTTLAWRNIGRNRRRSALSIIAIAVATLSIVLLFSVLEGMKSDLEHNLTTFFTGEIRIRHREYGTYEHLHPLHLSVPDLANTVDRVAAVDGVAAVAPRIVIPGAVFQNSERIGLQAVGVDFRREATYSSIGDYVVAGDLAAVTGSADAAGSRAAVASDAAGSAGPTSSRDGGRITPALVGNGVLRRLGIEVGDRFTIVVRTAQRGTNAMTFRAAAVADFPVESLNERAFWIPLDRAQRLAGMPDQAGEVLVKSADDAVGTAVAGAIQDALPEEEVLHFSEIESSYSFIELASAIYNVIALFFFLLASTVIVNTTMMAIFERRREIGTLEAMGMNDRELIRMFFVEALILGVIGAFVGLVLGVGGSALLGRIGIDFSASMEGVDFEISPVLYPVINLRSTLVVFVFSVVVSAATSYLPTRKITRIEPVEALREE